MYGCSQPLPLTNVTTDSMKSYASFIQNPCARNCHNNPNFCVGLIYNYDTAWQKVNKQELRKYSLSHSVEKRLPDFRVFMSITCHNILSNI